MLPDLELDTVAQGSEVRGSTMPVVPRMEMPSSIPRCGLKVFSARATPSGTEIVTAIFPEKPCAAHTSRTAEVIIARGVALIAADPTGCSSPGNVTRPTPTPPSTETSDSRAGTPLLPAAPVPDPGNFRFARGHALAARSARARPRMFHARVHEHAVGHIGIVACVLSHGALGAPLADTCVNHVRLDRQPAGGDDRHAADGLS